LSAFFSLVFSPIFLNILILTSISPPIDPVVLQRTLQQLHYSFYLIAFTVLTLLISLDLSPAFDTIDHSVLLKRLSCSFGVAGNVLSWIQSYLSGRTQSVTCGAYRFSLVFSQPTFGRRSPRLGPWTATFLHNYTLHLFPPLLIHTKSPSSSTRTTRNSMLPFQPRYFCT